MKPTPCLVYGTLLFFGFVDWLSPSLPFLASLQKLTFLSAPAKFLSLLGNEEFFLLLLPFIYWCISRRIGARLGVLFLLSASINEILKVGFALPRPYWLDPKLKIIEETSFGFPSGHAQNAALIWPFLAFQSRNIRVWLPLALMLAWAIAFSRLYLGVHFPADAFGGALIGFAILGLAVLGERHWVPFWREISFPTKIGMTVGLMVMLGGFYLTAVFFGPYKATDGYSSPSPMALTALQEAFSGHNISSRLGALFGLLVGFAATAHYLSYSTQVPLAQKAVRLLIGLVGIAVFYIGLKRILPEEVPFRFIRYALTTFWVGFGAPWVFGLVEGRGVQQRDVVG